MYTHFRLHSVQEKVNPSRFLSCTVPYFITHMFPFNYFGFIRAGTLALKKNVAKTKLSVCMLNLVHKILLLSQKFVKFWNSGGNCAPSMGCTCNSAEARSVGVCQSECQWTRCGGAICAWVLAIQGTTYWWEVSICQFAQFDCFYFALNSKFLSSTA